MSDQTSPPSDSEGATRAVLVNRLPATALAAQFEHNLAVVVGINAYEHIRTLTTARPDAERLAALLQDDRRDPHDRYEVIARVDQQATTAELRSLLFDVLPAQVRHAGPRTRLLFYFAGHGDAEDSGDGLKGFLFPQDANPDDETTLLPMGKVQDALAGLPCQHVLLILDCCSAGALPKPQSTRSALRPPPMYWDYLQRYVGRQARQVITSSAHNQQAIDNLGVRDENGGLGHSPFAAALFEALDPAGSEGAAGRQAGRNGVVTATELYLYVAEALYRRVGDAQTPGLWTVADKGHDQGDFVFLLPGTRLELDPAPDVSQPAYTPWPGLEALHAEQTELFAGRDKEIEDLAALVEGHPLLVVTGSSAAGKTSLVRAGVLPWLAEQAASQPSAGAKRWHVLPQVALGQAPFAALSRFLAEHLAVDAPPAEAAAHAAEPQALAAPIAAWVQAHPDQRLLLAIDADEALFDPAAAAERRLLWPILVQVAQQETVHVLVALRSDHWTELAAFPAATRYVLGPMNRDALRQVVELPAAARLIYLTPGALVDRLVDAVEGEPAALPLLSETLHRMYLRYAGDAQLGLRTDRTLTQEDYDALRGVAGVAADLAGAFYQELPDDAHRATAQHVLMRLVEVSEGRFVRRRAKLREFDYPDPQVAARAREILADLTARGLVVLDVDAEETPYVELGLSALADSWALLRGWLVDSTTQWGLQRELTTQVARWAPARQKANLWDDDPKLAQLEEVLWPAGARRQGLAGRFRRELRALSPRTGAPSDAAWLNQVEVEFVQTSVAERARFRQRLFGAVFAFVAVLALATVISLVLRDRAVREARRAKAGELTAVSQGILDDWPQQSLLLAVQAMQATKPRDGYQPGPEQALRNALQRTGGQVLNAQQGAIDVAAISPDGRWLVTGGEDAVVQLWNLDEPARPSTALRGHRGAIRAAAFTPDGRAIVTAGDDGVARLWDLQTPSQEAKLLEAHQGPIHDLAISGDGQWLVTAGEDGLIYRWDLARPAAEPAAFRGHHRAVYDVEISGDGRWLASAGWDGKIRKWDLDDPPAPAQEFSGHDAAVWSIAISPDGRWLASGSEHPTALLWAFANPSSPARPLTTGSGAVEAVAFTLDSAQLAVASDAPGAFVQLWNVADPAAGPRQLAGHTKPVTGLVVVDRDRLLTISDDRRALLWPLKALAEGPAVLAGHEGAVRAAAASSAGDRLVTADVLGSVRLWNPASVAASPITLADHSSSVTAVALSRDGRWLATAGLDGRVAVRSLLDPLASSTVLPDHDRPVRALAFSPNGQWLITAGDDRMARQWRLEDLSKPIRLMPDHKEPVTHLVVSGDSRWLVTASQDNTVRLWDLEDRDAPSVLLADHGVDPKALAISSNGQWVASGDRQGKILLSRPQLPDQGPQPFQGHDRPVTAIAFSPDNRWMASAGQDGKVFLVDLTQQVPSQQPLAGPQTAVNDVAFSPDNRWLAAGGTDRIVWLWTLKSLAGDPERLEGATEPLERLAFTPDGSRIVSASDDGTVRTWRVDDREAQSIVLAGPEGPVGALAIDGASTWVLAGGNDGKAALWSLDAEYLKQLACQTAGGTFDEEERKRYLGGVSTATVCTGLPVRPTLHEATAEATDGLAGAPPLSATSSDVPGLAATKTQLATQVPGPSAPLPIVPPTTAESTATSTSTAAAPTVASTSTPEASAELTSVCPFFFNNCTDYLDRYLVRARQGDPAVNDAADLSVRIVEADVDQGETYWRAIGVHVLLPDEDVGWHSAYAIFLSEAGDVLREEVNLAVGRFDTGDDRQERTGVVSTTLGTKTIPLGTTETSLMVLGSDVSRPEKSDRVDYLRAVHPRLDAGDRSTTVSGVFSFLVVYQRTQKTTLNQPGDATPTAAPVLATAAATPQPSPSATPSTFPMPTATADLSPLWPAEYGSYIERYALNAQEGRPAINDAADLYGVQIEEADVTEGETYWKAIGVHRLSAFENLLGGHFVRTLFLDANGLPVQGLNWVAWGYAEDSLPDLTEQSTVENGWAQIILFPGAEFSVAGIGGDRDRPEPSDRVDYLRTNHPRDPSISPTVDMARPQAFLVVFQRTQKATPPTVTLVFTEIMYDPLDGGEYEFIELTNIGGQPVDLSGATVAGIRYTFAPGSIIQPGTSIVLARDAIAFGSRYPGVAIAGQFAGRLANEGEQIELTTAGGQSLAAVTYGVGGTWPSLLDGQGSLTLIDPAGNPDDPANWRASSQTNGSPGTYPDN